MAPISFKELENFFEILNLYQYLTIICKLFLGRVKSYLVNSPLPLKGGFTKYYLQEARLDLAWYSGHNKLFETLEKAYYPDCWEKLIMTNNGACRNWSRNGKPRGKKCLSGLFRWVTVLEALKIEYSLLPSWSDFST